MPDFRFNFQLQTRVRNWNISDVQWTKKFDSNFRLKQVFQNNFFHYPNMLPKTQIRHIVNFVADILSTPWGYMKIIYCTNFQFVCVKNDSNLIFGLLTFYSCGLKPTDCAYFAFSKNSILWETQMLPIFVGWWKFFKNCAQKWKRGVWRLYCVTWHLHTMRITNFRLFPKSAFFPKKVTDQYILHMSKVQFT